MLVMTAHPRHAQPDREPPPRLAAGNQCLRGESATALLGQPWFVAAWSRLCDACPWATPFQAHAFVAPWYRAYNDRFEPLVLLRAGEDGSLVGLMTLAVQRSDGAVVAAGAWQAEYQGWLATVEDEASFAAWALATARNIATSRRLHLGYLAPGASLQWLRTSQLFAVSSLSTHARPLMDFGDGSGIADSLRKKANKKRLRDMERDFGTVEVRQVTDPGEFAAWLQQAIVFHDTRQLALHAIAPFEQDRAKATFHALLATNLDQAYVSVLTAGNTLASLQMGLLCSDELQLIFLAHNPFLSRYSPGKIHLYRMAQQLMQRGLKRIDLTAGGESYKERFATRTEPLYGLALHASPAHRFAHDTNAVALRVAKRCLKRLNLEPGRTVVTVRERLHPLRLLGSLLGRGMRVDQPSATDPTEQLEQLASLLRIRQTPLGPSRREIIAAALKQIVAADPRPAAPDGDGNRMPLPARGTLTGAGLAFSQKGKL
jgi:CelD/BcsL family acetyltransferase involved in cellulose biosynthesis